jgi:hypothetical protein
VFTVLMTNYTETPTTLDIVRNIEYGNRAEAAAQINGHAEPARVAVAVLVTIAENAGGIFDGKVGAWQAAAAAVVRTLNAGQPL